MGKFFKVLLGGVVVVVIVAALLVTFLLSNLDSLVKQAIETVGTEVVGTNVRVDQVSIALDEGRGEIAGLRIANPRGFPDGSALELSLIALDLDVQNISAELVTLESIIVAGARINAVQGSGGNNLQALLDNIRRSSDGGGSSSSGTDDGPDTKLIIDEFRFEDAQVSVAVTGLPGGRSASVPDVVLRDIGRQSNGVTASEAARQILEPLVQQSMEAGISVSRQELENRANQEAEKALDQGRKKLGEFLQR
jgi:hypothetical protein